MNNLDLLVGQTQRNLTYAYWALFGGVLAALIFLPRPIDESIRTLLITLAGVLGTLVTMQNQFWFARPRVAGVPDPTTTVTTSTGMPPDPVVAVTTTVPTPPQATP